MLSLERAEGELVVLRPLTQADVNERYLAWFRSPIVTRFLEARDLNRTEVVDYLEVGRRTRKYVIYAICDRQTMLHIGNIKIGPISWQHSVSDLVTFIGDTEYWGKGFAADAIRVATRIAFEVLDIRKLSASIHSTNHGSLKAYSRAGLQVEARLAEQYVLGGEFVDRVYVSRFNPQCVAAHETTPDVAVGIAEGSEIVAIVQARMSSSRLPGKVLKPLAGEPSLIRMLERVERSQRIKKVVVATSADPSDDAIAKLCEDRGILCSRGSLEDVLDRFYRAACVWHPEYVVRLTGDCPLIDPELVDRCIEECIVTQADYATNALDPTYPDGLDVEVIRYHCLQKAWSEASLRSDREHVTPYIYRNGSRFHLHSIRNSEDHSKLRWTVDEEIDYYVVAKIFEGLYEVNPNFSWLDALAYVETHSELKDWNSKISRNEGLKRSMELDHKQPRETHEA